MPGAIWSLKERGLLGAADVSERLAKLDALPKPTDPAAAPVKASLRERSWGDTFVPKSPPPARTIQTVSLHGLSKDERIAVTCLQGLLARKQPQLFLVRDAAEDQFWMDWCVAKDHVDAFEAVADWKSLVRLHRDSIKGVVVTDPALYRGDLLAVHVAACEDLLVASPKLAEELGLPVVVDLRGRFATYAEGLEWLWTTYKDRLNPHLCDFRYPGLLPFRTFDYVYQWRGLMFWVAGPREEHLAGVDRLAERDLVARILAEMPAGGVCVGFPRMDDGEGMGEPPGVEPLSRSGIENLTYSLPDGMPAFREVTSWRDGKEGFLREIREQVGEQRPAFVNGFVHCWTFSMDDLAKIHASRDADMVFVTERAFTRVGK